MTDKPVAPPGRYVLKGWTRLVKGDLFHGWNDVCSAGSFCAMEPWMRAGRWLFHSRALPVKPGTEWIDEVDAKDAAVAEACPALVDKVAAIRKEHAAALQQARREVLEMMKLVGGVDRATSDRMDAEFVARWPESGGTDAK